jgi:hypothetical protein
MSAYNPELANERILRELPCSRQMVKKPRAGDSVEISRRDYRAAMRSCAMNYRHSRNSAADALLYLNCAKTYRRLSQQN